MVDIALHYNVISDLSRFGLVLQCYTFFLLRTWRTLIRNIVLGIRSTWGCYYYYYAKTMESRGFRPVQVLPPSDDI